MIAIGGLKFSRCWTKGPKGKTSKRNIPAGLLLQIPEGTLMWEKAGPALLISLKANFN